MLLILFLPLSLSHTHSLSFSFSIFVTINFNEVWNIICNRQSNVIKYERSNKTAHSIAFVCIRYEHLRFITFHLKFIHVSTQQWKRRQLNETKRNSERRKKVFKSKISNVSYFVCYILYSIMWDGFLIRIFTDAFWNAVHYNKILWIFETFSSHSLHICSMLDQHSIIA